MSSEDEHSFDEDYDDAPTAIPILLPSEVRVGQLLGRGTFCKVNLIKDINLKAKTDPGIVQENRRILAAKYKVAAPQGQQLDVFGRKPNAQNPINPRPRMALKQLKDLTEKSKKQAKDDLRRECDILRAVKEDWCSHPNIIQLHAIGVESEDEFDDRDIRPCFLVLSKLKCTMVSFMAKWREQRGLGVMEFLGINIKEAQDMWLERLMVLSQIADAIRFLHLHNVIFRDIKPQNIGFDADNVPKLFDFGLAKRVYFVEENYKLTGNTGTLRYMAPEVAMDQPYGMDVDVYSLAILMHEVLSLKIPFVEVPASEFRHQVIAKGKRPPLDFGWPAPLTGLMASMWHETPSKRPPSAEVYKMLTLMLRGSDAGLFPESILM
ncbi:MAG: hypothetical protein SGBAC_004118 [Bacillariaceae sp.]